MIETATALKIPASVYSSDRAKFADFDATEWFTAASAEQILVLAKSGWRASEASREVARFAQHREDSVADVFQYAMFVRHGGSQCSCCCEIDSVAALEWLAYRRPDVLARLRALRKIV